MLNRLCQFLCALVLCLQLCGGHLGMLQVVAWGGMLVRYAQADGVVEGTRKTFDGNHKCSLCRAIDTSRAAENQSGSAPKAPAPDWKSFGKELALLSTVTVPARLDGDVHWLPGVEPSWLWPAELPPPPCPPPRAA